MSAKFPVSFTPRAERQAREANAWWRENRAAVPNAFSEELERVVELVASQPALGARAVNVRLAGVRRVLMHRVQHYLYYRVIEAPHRTLQVLPSGTRAVGLRRQHSRSQLHAAAVAARRWPGSRAALSSVNLEGHGFGTRNRPRS